MNIMEVRKATYDDIPRIMKICDEARGIMRSNGNFSQWTDGSPRIAFQKMGEHTYWGSTHILYF